MKEFIKFNFFKLMLTFVLMVLSIIGMRITIALTTPTENFESVTETLFFKLKHIFDFPAIAVSGAVGDLCSLTGMNDSVCFNIGGFSYFILNIFTFYLLACLIVFVFKKVRNRYFKKER